MIKLQSSVKIQSSSASKLNSYMNTHQMGFITAFRGTDEHGNAKSQNKNRAKNKELESDIRSMGLPYLKVVGGYIETVRGEDGEPILDTHGKEQKQQVSEDSFAIINNSYSTSNFIDLMVEWGRKYNQDSVLVTIPNLDFDGEISRIALENRQKYGVKDIVGKYYDQSGNIVGTLSDISYNDVEEYFTKIKNKPFEFKTAVWSEVSAAFQSLHPLNSNFTKYRSSSLFKQRLAKIQ